MRTILLLSLIFSTVAGARAELVNGIYVIVNNSVITYQEVEDAIKPAAELLYRQYRNQPQVFEQKLQQARTEKLEELIERQLILNEFESGGYMLPDSIIDDVIRDRIKERYGDRATLTKTLQAQGLTYEQFRKQVREDYIVRAMRFQKLSSEKILVSPHKIETYYNENQDKFKVSDQIKVRRIVLNKTAENPNLASKLAREIHNKLKEGASFAEMASVYSESDKGKGGEYGWIDRNHFKKELSDAAFALKAGQFSDVIELPEAAYLLYVEEAQTAHTRPLADVRDEIEKTLKAEQEAELKNKWIARLKAKSFVRYF